MPTMPSTSLPRPQCRGLIEARLVSGTKSFPSILFRGLSAAASLKRRVAWDADLRELRLFRGLSAAASLKPRHAPDARAGRLLFRGLSAAASLKPIAD